MADDRKLSHAAPPFAYKGAARPLARGGHDDGEAAGVREERRPSGLHTRPDLFGSSAVMAKPVDPPAEENGETEPPQSGEETLLPSTAKQQEEGAEPSEATPGAVTPAANLLDHPVRIPESISFEDWPDGPESEDGARAPQAAAPEVAELEPPEPQVAAPEAAEPEPLEASRAEVEPPEPPRAESDQDQMTPTYDPPPEPEPEEQTGRLGALLARLGAEGIADRLREQRWPLALGAVSFAALLLAALFGGVIPLTGDDREATNIAQGLGAQTPGGALPASENPAGLGETNPQDLSVAPAGNAFGAERPLGTSPDAPQAGSGAAPSGVADGSSQLAALPDTGGPDPLAGDREPIVDFMRIDPDGKAVVAGRAAPGTELIVLDNGEPLGTITADIYGLWTFVSQHPLADGRHEIGLRVKRQGSEISDPALVTESGSAGPLAPDPMTEAASSADLPAPEPAPEQLAAVEPETPVQSDQSPPQSVNEPAVPAAGDQALQPDPEGPAEAAPALTEAGQPAQGEEAAAAPSGVAQSAPATEQQAPSPPAVAESAQTEEEPLADADQPGTDAAPAAAAVAPAPAPKPEPPERTQTAALPADGGFVIQFAAFRNQDTAAREQALIEQRFSDLLAGQEVFVQKADLGDQGTFYRLRLGPFASLADARSTCARFQERERDCLALAR